MFLCIALRSLLGLRVTSQCQEPDWLLTTRLPVKWPNRRSGAYIGHEHSFPNLIPTSPIGYNLNQVGIMLSEAAVHFIAENFLTPLKELLVPAAVVLVCTVAPPAIIAGVGFTTGGVAAGSAAAGIQAGIGNVVAGSAFAVLQSLGTVPLTTAGAGAAVGAAGVAVGYGAAAASSVVGSLSAVAVKAAAAAAVVLL